MKLSEITLQIVKEYLRVDYEEEDGLITLFMGSAKNHLIKYTGLTIEAIELNENINIAYLALIQHFYDNRSMVVDEKSVNKIIQSILDMHSVNLL